MAVTAALFWISLILTAIGSNADGELFILHSPKSLDFTGSSKAFESSLTDIFSAALGLSVQEGTQWDGMLIKDPFNAPEAACEIYVDGVSSLDSAAGLKGKSYPLVVDEYEPDTFVNLKHRIKQRFTDGGNTLVNIKLSDPNQHTSRNGMFGEIIIPKKVTQPLKHLKDNVAEDNMFLSELEILKSITNKVRTVVKPDNVVDFYNFRFVSLHPLVDFYGPNSLQTKEAKKLLGEALEELSAAFVHAYDGSVLVTVVTTDVAHTRRPLLPLTRTVRELPEESEDNEEQEESEEKLKKHDEEQEESEEKLKKHDEVKNENNRDAGYSADYAAIFNIILWFGVIFSFTLIAIVYALIDMDPGRDSIIYRMTSTRMKKDN